MDIKIFSKSQIKHYRPQTETVLVSIQDVCDAHKSCNFVSHSLYRYILWLYFDDIKIVNPPYSFTRSQAEDIISTVTCILEQNPQITFAVHCWCQQIASDSTLYCLTLWYLISSRRD